MPPTSTPRVAQVCADLGLPERALDLEMRALSGGQAARAGLAAILLARFDVFLLDEPTNDLDFAGLARLERFLTAEITGGAMIVSHDRAFLDRTITSVLELDDHTHTATDYSGGWQAYLDERATARRHAEEAFDEYRAQRRELTDRAQRQRQWSVQGTAKVKKSGENDKHIRQFRRNSSEHVAAKAKITDRALARLESSPIDKPWEGWDLRMEIAAAPRGGAVVARLAGAVVQLGDFVLGPIDLQVDYGERVAILGANGSGKTTLLRTLLGQRRADAGEVWIGPGVVFGALDQARAEFAGGTPLLERFETSSGLPAPDVRSLLAKFGLGAEHVQRAADSLSPGERTRGVARAALGARCQLPRPRRADEPPGPAGDRAARIGTRELLGHIARRHPRPDLARGPGAHPPDRAGRRPDHRRRARLTWKAIAAAVATFSESAPGAIGMRTRMSAARSQPSESPGPSGAEQQGDARRPGKVVDRRGLGMRGERHRGESGGAELLERAEPRPRQGDGVADGHAHAPSVERVGALVVQ